MIIYTLYLKEHSVTGLKYLGYTKHDITTYNGSGKYWLRHLKTHGNEHTTQILLQTSDKEEIKSMGRYYSNLWDIVNAKNENGDKIWANLRIEQGDGGNGYEFSDEDRINIGLSAKAAWSRLSEDDRVKRVQKTKESLNRPEVREKLSRASKEAQNRSEVKERVRSSAINTWSDPELRARQSVIATEINARPEVKKKKSISVAKSWTNSQVREDRLKKMTDNNIYEFQNTVTGEIVHKTRKQMVDTYNMNRAQLSKVITGKSKSIKGWKKL
jgi:hypothetical protein